jgi:L-seryl-tRNA(Ser) seleniumtransferase
VLNALQELALAYLDKRAATDVAFWRMVDQPVDVLRARADRIVAATGAGSVVDTLALPGAGSAPGVSMPSVGVAIPGDRLAELRGHTTPVIARTRDGRTVLDLRSVDADDDTIVSAALSSLAAVSP